jgi:hypothetical protein
VDCHDCGGVFCPASQPGAVFLDGLYPYPSVWRCLGATATSLIFSVIIVVLVGGLSLLEWRKRPQQDSQ